ncbi:heme lyase CcmF/NrfE family subunit [Oceanicaulis sp. AH-315-P02]|nr:heme lyase CcmF/NrfE family subunit [Robiginitomaculum sp.]MBN4047770.1 heme lyase CcmF/NrfE family subunit [Oceanicaulis sp. AH-315-P02]
MTAEIGNFTLILAFLLAAIQSVVPFFGVRTNNLRLMQLANFTAVGQLIFILIAFIALTISFVTSDFSVKLVASHSHTLKPLLYKFTGVWANHEGSMLLWVVILCLYGAAVPLFGKALPDKLKALALAVQGIIATGFIGFVLFTSNPFSRLPITPIDGNGLNPLLQDPGLAFHPPFLYLGYVGFSMTFSFCVAALMEGRVDALWARWLRPWVLAAWSFLTIGIALGSVWAYYELGWGGWWFWDPVENASLLPWLAGTALLHSIMVVERRHSLVTWTVLLGILTFSLSLIGTFLVRSGIITSVHAFANDPERGFYILVMSLLATGGALTLYAFRSGKLRRGNGFEVLSKEAGLAINNILLVCATAIVFLGTFYPLFVDIFSDEKITVGPPFFNLNFGYISAILIVFMGIGPMLKWRIDSWHSLTRPIIMMTLGSIVVFAVIFLFGMASLGVIGFALAFWLIAGTCITFGRKIQLAKRSPAQSWKLLKNLSAGTYGFIFAHLGVAVMVIGVTGMSLWAKESILMMQPQQTTELGGYTIELRDVRNLAGINYSAETARFNLSKNGKHIGTLSSERRFYPVREMQTTEAGIFVRPTKNVYVALGQGDTDKGWAIRIYYHPFVNWVWIGALLMALGGFVALADRRLRLPKQEKVNTPGQQNEN